MTKREKLLSNISRKTGLTPAEIAYLSPNSLRSYLTKRTHKVFKIISMFPLIGRGNVLREGIVDTATLNRQTDKRLGV